MANLSSPENYRKKQELVEMHLSMFSHELVMIEKT